MPVLEIEVFHHKKVGIPNLDEIEVAGRMKVLLLHCIPKDN